MFLEKAIHSSNVKSNGETNPSSKPVVALIVEAGKFAGRIYINTYSVTTLFKTQRTSKY